MGLGQTRFFHFVSWCCSLSLFLGALNVPGSSVFDRLLASSRLLLGNNHFFNKLTILKNTQCSHPNRKWYNCKASGRAHDARSAHEFQFGAPEATQSKRRDLVARRSCKRFVVVGLIGRHARPFFDGHERHRRCVTRTRERRIGVI